MDMKLKIGTKDWPLSPSSLNLWLTDKREFLMRYLGKSGFLQSLPMAVGSAFDSVVKSRLLGAEIEWNGIELPDEQVPSAHAAGYECMKVYEADGGWAELLRLIDGRPFDVSVDKRVEIGGVWFRIKPDLVVDGWLVLDWKVSGYCSSASPQPGYLGHKDCMLGYHKGIMCDVSGQLWRKQDWALQLLLYTWGVTGEVGPALGCIDQLSFRNGKGRFTAIRSMLDPRDIWNKIEELMAWDVPEEDVKAMENMKALPPDWRELLGRA
jgi:hypothetical protein